MKNSGHLAWYYFKKERGQYLSFGVLLFLTALVLNLALVLSLHLSAAYDAKFESLNTANINLIVPEAQASQALDEKIEGIGGVETLERREAVFLKATIRDFRGTDFDMNTVFYNMADTHRLNGLEILESADTDQGRPVFLPLYMAAFGQFGVGDAFVCQAGDEALCFTVAGVVQEMQYGNLGSGVMGVYLPEEAYSDLEAERPGERVCGYAVKTSAQADPQTVERDIAGLLADENVTVLYSQYDAANKAVRTMLCELVIAVLSVFALFVLLVSLLLCRFRIKNAIEEDMAGMGVLKALGTTSGAMAAAIILPIAAVGLVAVLAGVGASYALLPALAEMIELQAGFVLSLGFDPWALGLIALSIEALVILFAWTAARRIRKLEPINAIRGMAGGGRAKKNRLPIDQTAGSIHVILALKNMLSAVRQNVLIFCVLFAMTVLVSFTGILFYNVIIEPENFMSALSDEVPDIIVDTRGGSADRVRTRLKDEENVREVLRYSQQNVRLENEPVTAFVCEDFSRAAKDLCYEGRNPVEPDEVAVGSALAQNSGWRIGDRVTIASGGGAGRYRVVGLVQSVNCQGKLCALTTGGFSRLGDNQPLQTLYLYLDSGTDAAAFISGRPAMKDGDIVQAVDYSQIDATGRGMYAQIVELVVAAVFVLTALIVLLALYMIMKSLIGKRRQELGILKAIGYSDRQLILQLAGGFVPVSALAIFASASLGCLYMPRVCDALFKTVGAMKNGCQAPFGVLMLFGAALLVLTVVISLGLSLPVRKISACALIKE